MNRTLIEVSFKPKYFIVDMSTEEFFDIEDIKNELLIDNSYIEESISKHDIVIKRITKIEDIKKINPDTVVIGINNCIKFSGKLRNIYNKLIGGIIK